MKVSKLLAFCDSANDHISAILDITDHPTIEGNELSGSLLSDLFLELDLLSTEIDTLRSSLEVS